MAAFCPLLSEGDLDHRWECAKDSCQWYVNGKCAIVTIAEKLEEDN